MSGTWICSNCEKSNPMPDGKSSRPQVLLEMKTLFDNGSAAGDNPVAINCRWCGEMNIV